MKRFFVVSNMSAIGQGLTLRQIRVPLGNLGLVLTAGTKPAPA